ncbi:hypothetical protein J5X84_43140 [Streptosporangiaceae bacterium NEAU-GS5]|nr:hypothetical protein [Streptosporangiaceae bacterium NEAU-GS5]
MRLYVMAAACLIALVGCGSGGTGGGSGSSNTLPLPDGFKRIGGSANGISVAVPEGWTTIDLSSDSDFASKLEKSGLSGSALQQAKAGLEALKANKAIYATDPDSIKQSSNQFATNLNGFCQASVGASADALIEEAKKQLASVNAQVSEAAEVPLGASKGVRIKYALPMAAVTVKGTQYYVPSDKGKTCIVTLSTDLDGKDALFDQIGGTVAPV